jgi:hypothetical protein
VEFGWMVEGFFDFIDEGWGAFLLKGVDSVYFSMGFQFLSWWCVGMLLWRG